jgi:hypothetical protein
VDGFLDLPHGGHRGTRRAPNLSDVTAYLFDRADRPCGELFHLAGNQQVGFDGISSITSATCRRRFLRLHQARAGNSPAGGVAFVERFAPWNLQAAARLVSMVAG